MMREKPTHKECRQCGEWFELPPYAPPKRRFCSVSCWAKWRNSQPKWRKAQSERAKAHADPEVMRERARSIWRNPELRARLSAQRRELSRSKEHLAHMVEHNKKLWENKEFRKRHAERSRQQIIERWRDPIYRAKMSAQTIEQNKQRWADPRYAEKTSRNIRIAKAAPLGKRRQREHARELAQRPEEKARRSRQRHPAEPDRTCTRDKGSQRTRSDQLRVLQVR